MRLYVERGVWQELKWKDRHRSDEATHTHLHMHTCAHTCVHTWVHAHTHTHTITEPHSYLNGLFDFSSLPCFPVSDRVSHSITWGYQDTVHISPPFFHQTFPSRHPGHLTLLCALLHGRYLPSVACFRCVYSPIPPAHERRALGCTGLLLPCSLSLHLDTCKELQSVSSSRPPTWAPRM